jgi:signal transduction histidine kinase
MKRRTPFTIYLIAILIALIATVILSILMLRPPRTDIYVLALLLGGTGMLSAVVGFLSLRMGWWQRIGSLNMALTFGYLLAAALTLVNVWVTAKLMFISGHDLALSALLLLFAGGISVAFGYFVSDAITQTLRDLAEGAERVREGDFTARVRVQGPDEIARLGMAFNDMAADLQTSAARAEALDMARRNLVAWASHDLRTPLASLRAMIDALADGVASDPETTQRYLHQSQQEIARMSALINDLFDMAQLDAEGLILARETSSLGDLISDTLAAFGARAAARGVTLTGSVEAGVDPLWMASDKISRVLHNLVDNALRYTPERGRVTISAMCADDLITVMVRDSGAGISSEDLPHIFERFYRGEKSRSREGSSGGGAGLGLAIAQRLVEAHGGMMSAASSPGEGAVFTFTLPKRKKEMADAEVRSVDGNYMVSGGLHTTSDDGHKPAG